MDASDLRAELNRRASQVPSPATSTRLAAVRRRVRARQQRVAGGMAGLAVVGVGVGALLVPELTDGGTTRVEPATPPSTQQVAEPEPIDRGSWPTRVDGNPLVVDRVTRHFVHSRTWTVTAPTSDLSVSVFCRLQPALAREGEAVRPGPMVSLSVNGHSYVGTSCVKSQGLDAERPVTELYRKAMRAYGVRAGEPFDVTLTVGRDAHLPAWRAQLGLGLYARTGELREVAPGWSIPVVRGVPGNETTLYEVFTSPVRRQGGELVVTTRRSTPPGTRLTFGWLVTGYRGYAELTIDGAPEQQSSAGGIVSDVPFEGRHEIVVRARGGVGRGTLMLAMYEPVEEQP